MGKSDYEKAQARRALFEQLTAERDRTNDALMAAAPGLIDRLTTVSGIHELVFIIRDAAILMKPAFLADQALENYRKSDD